MKSADRDADVVKVDEILTLFFFGEDHCVRATVRVRISIVPVRTVSYVPVIGKGKYNVHDRRVCLVDMEVMVLCRSLIKSRRVEE